jgi:hypothetical protein
MASRVLRQQQQQEEHHKLSITQLPLSCSSKTMMFPQQPTARLWATDSCLDFKRHSFT